MFEIVPTAVPFTSTLNPPVLAQDVPLTEATSSTATIPPGQGSENVQALEPEMHE